MKRNILVAAGLAILVISLSAAAQTIYITRDRYMIGMTYEAFMKSQEYLAQKDQAALDQLIATGLVGPLKPGVRVYIVDTRKQRVPILGRLVTGLVKIRPLGTTLEGWTNVEAVKQE